MTQLHINYIQIHLHSTMVLFKFERPINVLSLFEFTFHYGSIQIERLAQLMIDAPKFTFHYGSIQITIIYFVATSTHKFTFHYGSIQIRASEHAKHLDLDLHSTMVLFKLLLSSPNISSLYIYIPLWFYSNPSLSAAAFNLS